ncbi:MAG: PAS domain-containing sensor histidine kinase [bacterium]
MTENVENEIPALVPTTVEPLLEKAKDPSSELEQKDILVRHITISITTVIVLMGLLFWVTPFFTDIFLYPQKYFNLEGAGTGGGMFTSFSASGFEALILLISAYITTVLIGYIVYLLLTSTTRAELISSYKTKKLLGSKMELEEIYENAPIPYLTINEEGEIHGCNKSALRFFGVIPAEISGKNFFFYTAEEDKELGEKFLNFYKSNLPINKEEIRMITKEGSVKWASISIFQSKDFSTGKKSGLVTVFDITEQKQLDQAKTEFVSLASHQLRTPLATIKWYTEMLSSGDLGVLTDKQKEYLGRMARVNKDMVDLVETLLNVSRIEIGTLAITKESTNVPLIVDGIIVELASQIDAKKIVFNKKYNNALSNVNSDPKLLRIVIQNLITNAIKYNRDGGSITIDLQDGVSLDQGEISVTDTGLGIPKDQQNRVFSKLFRAKNVQDVSSSQSTGLGLYLVKSVAEALGGSISFASEENVGSTFTLRL